MTSQAGIKSAGTEALPPGERITTMIGRSQLTRRSQHHPFYGRDGLCLFRLFLSALLVTRAQWMPHANRNP